jgi:hypothetical protein
MSCHHNINEISGVKCYILAVLIFIINLAAADTHSPYSQNMFDCMCSCKLTPYLADDELLKKRSSHSVIIE